MRMPLNTWWEPYPTEHYWMETVRRPDIGGHLFGARPAPGESSIAERETISRTSPGDVVFHWSLVTSALVGHSLVASQAATDAIQEPGEWRTALTDFQLYASPLDLPLIRTVGEEILAAQAAVMESHRGSLYLPFERNRGTIRPSMGYLHKMPASVADIIASLVDVQERPPALPEPAHSDEPAGSGAGAGRRELDAEVRTAIEVHAVKRAIAYYAGPGVTIRELGKPYDLLVTTAGLQVHVEVKGSRSVVAGVELTRNEVTHGRTHAPTDLFVVDQITCAFDDAGKPITSGGRARIWTDWTPQERHLTPSRYAYKLPPGEVLL